MNQLKRLGDLEINQDLPHARLEWRIERVGWVVMMVILLGALAGLLGPGPLSSAGTGEKESIHVEYDRFGRYQAPTTLRVHLGPAAVSGGRARLWLSREYVESVELIHIDPEPESVEAAHDRFVYTFRISGSKPLAVTYHLEANAFWDVPVSLGLEGGAALHFTQFIYP